ncbi:MAG: uroporphyrinogen-III synthase [Zymomonas mobilis]|uniref:Uroporphyrinogen-III synthase-like protein n=1 Tax=Zymomonas mobilis subsp. mobilis (strain ATCC 10988 / DSM 424 / LMG 404 / NCIMB 8938 / NRRL B-806 / ZM1) TaxID=555217 RepID=A0A0H3G2S3_ZYMMA|nr:uroporphyrinogen-III synthase [Zymomonas mobilis]ACV75784.1 Uroporphyrinogen-III synthase-like protein [Zymomonas mobilis subsp. mobilis NCIMB 11163]AEH63093.1 uroporphyrinogen-III synthase-like protein [Zymomonas mobilis subsp. mobilis ATCC 10988]AHB10572.1 uroporphyrinogen-III synthase [Zymomonas mobilis subsp. mobilis str. CP4 = NRRL B-14023]AHJ70879.1 uroporphyrinogen-III synthase [Zymomonas mobilis subsp. mobilis NRRL B-12526]AHJ72732.1 uroporphyrinogen-III synthase [Zymomonas mobilis 
MLREWQLNNRVQDKLLILRPEPGATATAKRAEKVGWQVIKTPLATAISIPWSINESLSFDAVMVTSAQAIYHGGSELDKLKDYPLYVVGKATEAAARQAGFQHIVTAEGNGASVLCCLERDKRMRILRLCGEIYKDYDYKNFSLKENTQFFIKILYRMQNIASLPIEACQALVENAIVLLHSSRFAEQFRLLLAKTDINPDRVQIAVISPAVAEQIGKEWRAMAIAEYPDDTSLLKAAASLK